MSLHSNLLVLLVAAVFLISGASSIQIKNKLASAAEYQAYGTTNPGQACKYQTFGSECIRGYTCSLLSKYCTWDLTIKSSSLYSGSTLPGQACKYQKVGTQCIQGYVCNSSQNICVWGPWTKQTVEWRITDYLFINNKLICNALSSPKSISYICQVISL